MTKPKLTKMWCPVEFKEGIYKLKSESTDQTLTKIMQNLGKQIKLGEIKLSKSKDDFWE